MSPYTAVFMTERICSAIAVAILIVLSGGFIHCGHERQKPYNVVLIIVDTLRADRLHYAGNPRSVSPEIDRLAAEGVVFPVSYSQAGWTIPAVASIMTGRYPRDHTATDFRHPIDMALPTMAGILSRNDYDTKGYVSHFMLNPNNGFSQGFNEFDSSVLSKGHPHNISSSREVTDLALAGLRSAKEPFFLWVHYFDPHFEYLSHSSFSSFGDSEIDRYDQEIAYTDFHIGRLLERISDEDTIVIFTSDHGEEVGEHGGKYHYTLYDDVMRTPLIIKAPFLEPGINEGSAEQIDILPTLLGLLDLEVGSSLPGRDLFDSSTPEGPVFIERDRPPLWRQRGVIAGNHKLWVIEEFDIRTIPAGNRETAIPVENVHPGIYMYDLAADPGEKNNIYSEKDPKALELLGIMTRHFSVSKSPTRRVKLEADTLEKLRSLGYVE